MVTQRKLIEQLFQNKNHLEGTINPMEKQNLLE